MENRPDGACELGSVLCDAGYWSEGNASYAKDAGPDFHIATNKDWKQRKALREAPPPRGRIPRGLSERDRMERKLLTRAGRALYKKRGCTVEPVFGQVKSANGFDRFSRRGKQACQNEWKFFFATYNLMKLWRHTLSEAVKRGSATAIWVKKDLTKSISKVLPGLSGPFRAACSHFGSRTLQVIPS